MAGNIFIALNGLILASFKPTAKVIIPPQALKSANIPSFNIGTIIPAKENKIMLIINCGIATRATN